MKSESITIALVTAKGQPTHCLRATVRSLPVVGTVRHLVHHARHHHNPHKDTPAVHIPFPTSRHPLGIVCGTEVHSGMDHFILGTKFM